MNQNRVAEVNHKPGFVLHEKWSGDHQSRPAVANRLKQSTRKYRTSSPQTLSYLILLQIGFTKLPLSPAVLVSSYLAFSPLPPTIKSRVGCVFFCGTFLKVALTPRYGVSCPVEPGLSSLLTQRPKQRSPGLLRHWIFRYLFPKKEPYATIALMNLFPKLYLNYHLR